MEYLLELRTRLIYCFAITLFVFVTLSFFANPLYQMLAKPLLRQLSSQQLIATKLPATFLAPLKLTFMTSLCILVPFFSYHVWSFISPALYSFEKKTVWMLLFPTVLFFYTGVIFAYFVVLPLCFHFFIQATPSFIQLLPDVSAYLEFVLQLLFAFGISFEVPIIIVVLVKFKFFTLLQLQAARRYVIVMAFFMGMLLTPPDVFSQTLLAIPLWLLYELGLIFCRLIDDTP